MIVTFPYKLLLFTLFIRNVMFFNLLARNKGIVKSQIPASFRSERGKMYTK